MAPCLLKASINTSGPAPSQSPVPFHPSTSLWSWAFWPFKRNNTNRSRPTTIMCIFLWYSFISARDHPGFPECGFPDYNFSLISWLCTIKNQLRHHLNVEYLYICWIFLQVIFDPKKLQFLPKNEKAHVKILIIVWVSTLFQILLAVHPQCVTNIEVIRLRIPGQDCECMMPKSDPSCLFHWTSLLWAFNLI